MYERTYHCQRCGKVQTNRFRDGSRSPSRKPCTKCDGTMKKMPVRKVGR